MAVHVPSIILVIPSSLLQTLPGVTFYPTLHPLPEEEPAKKFYWRSYAEQSSSVTASAYPLLLNMPERYFFLNKRAVLCLRVILSSFKVIQVKLQPLFKNDIFSSCKIWMSDNSHHPPHNNMVHICWALSMCQSPCQVVYLYYLISPYKNWALFYTWGNGGLKTLLTYWRSQRGRVCLNMSLTTSKSVFLPFHHSCPNPDTRTVPYLTDTFLFKFGFTCYRQKYS